MMAVFCGVTALSGHLWPVYLRFRGGKGVATGAGVVFALNWMAGLAALGVFLVVLALFRYVSLGSICAAAVFPAVQALTGSRLWEPAAPVTIFCVAAAAAVIARHHENIRRLLSGTESRVGARHD